MSDLINLLTPDRCVRSVADIDVAELSARGIRAVLLDLDNTLTEWQREAISPGAAGWLDALRASGMRLCLVSNTRFGKRLRRLSAAWNIPFVPRASKPGSRGFQEAMRMLGVGPTETAMVGDQMFTDVLGGRRAGLYTIMVEPLAPREFVGTKLSRGLEWLVLRYLRKKGRI